MALQDTRGMITVHSPNLVETLRIDRDDHIYTTMVKKGSKQRLLAKRPWSTPIPSRSLTSISSRVSTSGSSVRSTDQMTKIQNWISEKSVRHIQEKADPERLETKKLYMSLLDEEDGFVKDIDEFVTNKDYLDLRKKEMLHKKWSERVYEPLQKQIYREMKVQYPGVESRKRNLHDNYVDYCNRRPVFLDTMSKNDYNPLELQNPRPAPIIATTEELEDPLIAQEKVRNEEDKAVVRCMTGKSLSDKEIEQYRLPPLPLVPLGRHGTECSSWLAMKLHDIDSDSRVQSRRRMKSNFNDSQYDSEEWSNMPFDPKIVDEEMQCQKKRMYSSGQHPIVFT
ncbi:protein FAM228B-like [Saccoglossus kowalevskii]